MPWKYALFTTLIVVVATLVFTACATAPGADSATQQQPERAEGQHCTDASDCESGMCINRVCASECTADTDCEEGWECHNELCQAPVCESDADCAGGQSCGVVTAGDGDGLATVCHIGDGRYSPGANCSQHDECRGGYCLDGTCSAPCADETDCGSNQVCGRTAISLDGHEANVQICSPMGVARCQSPDDCERDDMTCNAPIFDAAGEVDGVSCGYINEGGLALGEECTYSSDCESDVCLPREDGSGTCSLFCEDSRRDCTDGQVCTPTVEGFGVCAQACKGNADCGGGDVCTVGAGPGGQPMHFCEPPHGDKLVGENCNSDEDCTTNFCLTNVLEYEIECVGDEQCPDDARCGCHSLNPDCEQHVCYIEQSVCSTPCNPDNGHADCEDNGHDLSRCDENVTIQTDTGPTTTPACAPTH